MSVYNALNRLKWRFTTGKEFKPNQNDINALNELIEFYSGVENSVLRENMAFSKIFVYIVSQLIWNYNQDKVESAMTFKKKFKPTDIYSDVIQRKMAEILQTPYEIHIEQLREKMNEVYQYNFNATFDIEDLEKVWEHDDVKKVMKKFILNALVYGNTTNYRPR